MTVTKQVTVYVSRKFTLNRKGRAPVQFLPGANVVDTEAAAHPFVKALTVGAIESTGDGVALQARIAELETQAAYLQERVDVLDAAAVSRAETSNALVSELQEKFDAMHTRAETAEAQVVELQAVVDAAAAMGGATGKKK